MKKKLKRCFIALDLPGEIINEIIRIQDIIKESDLLLGTFTKPENIHLTLKFLGEIDDDKIEKVKKLMKNLMINNSSIHLSDIGFFTNKNIHIIWIQLQGESVFELQKKIDKQLKEIFDEEVRFMSHITLVRVKHIKDKKLLLKLIKEIKVKKIIGEVKSFQLMESDLTSYGPVYSSIQKYSL